MHISLTQRLERFVTEKVDSGLYASQSEVIREALRSLVGQEGATGSPDPAPRREVPRENAAAPRAGNATAPRAGSAANPPAESAAEPEAARTISLFDIYDKKFDIWNLTSGHNVKTIRFGGPLVMGEKLEAEEVEFLVELYPHADDDEAEELERKFEELLGVPVGIRVEENLTERAREGAVERSVILL